MTKEFIEALQNARGFESDYANSYIENIFRPMDEKYVRMFCGGGGKELLPKDGKREKAACVYSSSMLVYNFFSWINKDNSLEYEGVVYDKVVFEEQFRVLKNRNNKANIDVMLVSKDNNTILLFESKFTEHLSLANKVSYISDAYEMSESYFSNGNEWKDMIGALKHLTCGKVYYDGLKQVVCHLIGISSLVLNADSRKWFNNNSWLKYVEGIELDETKNYIFKSIVFHPRTKQDNELTDNYKILNKEFVGKINFLPDNISVENPIITYMDIWNAGMKESIKDNELKSYLERYLEVHV